MAAGRELVVTAGSGLTLTCKVADFDESLIEVAVTVAVKVAVTDAGAWYVADVVVGVPLNEPPPETLHVTPAPFESCATEAVIASVWA